MGSIAFLVLSGPYTFQGTHTMIQLANAALDKGHDITGIFFFVDGVINVNKNIKAEEGMFDIPVELMALHDKGVKIAACSACSEYRGIAEQDIFDGVELSGLATFSEYYDAADKVVVFGM
ncbi:MAG TPA: DsrE family protein [Candidatus Lokiarchaeia archaeon]|nr:DsrE family protein [Candidatus Lokiarchaeia archaeon]